MKTAELASAIFFWMPLCLLPGRHHLETGDLLHLLKPSASSLDVIGSQLVINWFSTSVSKGDRQTAYDSSCLGLKTPVHNKIRGKTIALKKQSRSECYPKEGNPGWNLVRDYKESFTSRAHTSFYSQPNITLLGIITIDYRVIYTYHTVLGLSVYTSASLESGFFESRDHLIIKNQALEHRVHFYEIVVGMKCLSKKHFGTWPKEVICNLNTFHLGPQKPSNQPVWPFYPPFDNSSLCLLVFF